MQFHDECTAATSETVDDDELPQRTCALKRIVDDQRRKIEQLALCARRGQRHAAHVIVDVELGVVDPAWRTECGRGGAHTLSQPRHRDGRTLHAFTKQREVDRSIDHCDVAEGRSEKRIFLHPPHQPLGFAHA